MNLFVALVGPSGAGKGAAGPVADAAFPVSRLDVATVPLGSGEGIADTYRFWCTDRDEETDEKRSRLEWRTHSALFTGDEVSAVGAVASRNGSTLMSLLKSAYSGAELGFGYKGANRVTVPAMQYRLGVIIGVQPGLADVLLSDTVGGTPQRFLWLPAIAPGDVSDALAPEPQPRVMWMPPLKARGTPSGLRLLTLPDEAVDAMRRSRVAVMRGELPELDGHALNTQARVAAIFALVDGRMVLNDDDWRLAGTVMEVSNRTRAYCVDALAKDSAAKNRARGRAEAERSVVAEEERDRHRLKRVSAKVLHDLQLADGWVKRRQLRSALRSDVRDLFDDAAQSLIDAALIERREVSGRGTNTFEFRTAA